MRRVRVVVALLVVAIAVPLQAVPAAAAAPNNDTFAGATAATVGSSEVLPTGEATTDSDDTQLNSSCGAPATDASVWYAFTNPSATGVIVDTSGSDYSVGVLVGTGTQGALSFVNCGQGSTEFTADAGTTYYVLAVDDQRDGAGNGGSLHISFTAVPPPPTVTVTMDPTGRFDHDGVAHLSGTYSCLDSDFISVSGDVIQSVGRFSIEGSFVFNDSNTCDGLSHPWSAAATSDNGDKFAGGWVQTDTFAFSCNESECGDMSIAQPVRLRGGKPEQQEPTVTASSAGGTI